MTELAISAGRFRFKAVLEEALAPNTCKRILDLLPYEQQLIHVRWSGEGCWIPLGDTDFDLGPENATAYPHPGHIILYPGGVSETEILLAYGSVSFASKMGPLAGNHFMTITEGREQLFELGNEVLWKGAQPIRIERLDR